MQKSHVLIPASGSGSRMQASLPKQYLPLLGQSVVLRTVNLFLASPCISSVHVVLNPDDEIWATQVDLPASDRLHVHYQGGETRSDSVLNGLNAMRELVDACDWILVHDAARPMLTPALLQRLIETVQHDDVGGLLAIPLADTLKRADPAQRVASTEPRDALWQAQTPQMFPHGVLTRALEYTRQLPDYIPTDEAQAMEALGLKPLLVQGELRNLKITYPQDLWLAEAILRADQSQGELA
ncbi:MAG TPA: 2-C-methyl-D-erythritol 4-phosphate cytidylyltransferase [Methylovorus sp.]|nr:2-C-methyl-D-erythritol 4-phosphate cytidylyltransferase [Methylovorus sp.]